MHTIPIPQGRRGVCKLVQALANVHLRRFSKDPASAAHIKKRLAQHFYPPRGLDAIRTYPRQAQYTEGEIDQAILGRLRGKSNREIAKELGRSLSGIQYLIGYDGKANAVSHRNI